MASTLHWFPTVIDVQSVSVKLSMHKNFTLFHRVHRCVVNYRSG